VRYACIHRHAGAYAVALMCRVLRVSRPGYYAWRCRPPSARACANLQLLTAIRAVHQQSRARYGSPRVTRELQAQGYRCSEPRVARLMRLAGVQAKRRRRFRVTTDSRHGEPVAPNRLQRRFAVPTIGGVNRVWASDITYVPTREGWLYLAVVLDLASRRVIGWAMRACCTTLERGLTLDALQMALAQRQPAPGVLHHADRGSQYACGDYQARLTEHGMISSMSRKGDCWDNAVVESFFATFKAELVDDADWHTREKARTAIFEYIEAWYNRARRHSSLGYRSPVEYEMKQLRQAA
jgi:putative transposase